MMMAWRTWTAVWTGIVAVGVSLVGQTAQAEIQGKEVVYQHDGVECRGYLAWDDAVSGQRPGVLVVHEWWGLNEYARQRAREIAALGYLALAPDMYGEGKTAEHPQEAGQMAAKVRENVAQWRARATTALEFLKAQPQCDTTRLAAIGYCFGGSTALQLAYTGADLRAVVTFHAALPTPTPEEAKQIKAAILVNHGAADSFIPEAAIKAFRSQLDQGQVKYEFVAYPEVRHSFTVKDAGRHGIEGMKYDAAADQESWKRMQDLLATQFK